MSASSLIIASGSNRFGKLNVQGVWSMFRVCEVFGGETNFIK